jgi:tetratricopeptide (TPR) repeat protein
MNPAVAGMHLDLPATSGPGSARGTDRSVGEMMAAAEELHQAGEIAQAAELYVQVLARDPSNAPALHLLGLATHQRGDHARAVELISASLALKPSSPVWHASMAEVYRSAGQLQRAEGCCRLALILWHDCPEALCNLGLILHMAGRRLEAAEQFRRALQARPDVAAVHNNLGVVLKEIGQLDDALDNFRRAAELDPTFAPALSNLGQALLERGCTDDALSNCLEAVRIQPDAPAFHYNLANVFRALRRNVEARTSYLESLRLDSALAPAHAHLGQTLLEDNQALAALPWLKQAVELDPANAAFHEMLGRSYTDLEDYPHAVDSFRRALLNPTENRARLLTSLGEAMESDGRLDDAGEQYRAALCLQPDSARIHIKLGGLHEAHGRLAEAEACYRAARNAQPLAPLPHAELAVLLREQLPAADEEALRERLAGPCLEPGVRARLLFGLAHVLDARGDYAGAAERLQLANAIRAEAAAARGSCRAAGECKLADAIIGAFDGSQLRRLSSHGSGSELPVFVFGLPRSGTTLIEQVLASHPDVHGAGELQLASRAFRSIPDVVGRRASPADCIPSLDGQSVERLAVKHLGWLDALPANGARRVVDKMPGNYIHLGLLATMFPRATFIHCRRDMRDVAVSCWMTDFGKIEWSNDFRGIAAAFHEYTVTMDHWRVALPVTVHAVDYEDAVADLESVASRLLAACGLGWNARCLEFHRNGRAVRTASVVQVRRPLYRHAVGRWRHYALPLAGLFAALPARNAEATLDHGCAVRAVDPGNASVASPGLLAAGT